MCGLARQQLYSMWVFTVAPCQRQILLRQNFHYNSYKPTASPQPVRFAWQIVIQSFPALQLFRFDHRDDQNNLRSFPQLFVMHLYFNFEFVTNSYAKICSGESYEKIFSLLPVCILRHIIIWLPGKPHACGCSIINQYRVD